MSAPAPPIRPLVRLGALALLLGGASCIHVIDGPERLPEVPPGAVAVPGVHALVDGATHAGDDFVTELRDALERRLDTPVTIDELRPSTHQIDPWRWDGDDDGGWALEAGVVNVRLEPYFPFWCGTFRGLIMLGTLGTVPDRWTTRHGWSVELFDEAGHPADVFDFDYDRTQWTWWPLLPLMPLEWAYRTVAGDVEDRLVEELPAELEARLAAIAAGPDPARERRVEDRVAAREAEARREQERRRRREERERAEALSPEARLETLRRWAAEESDPVLRAIAIDELDAAGEAPGPPGTDADIRPGPEHR